MIIMKGQKIDVKFSMYPVSWRKKPNPTNMIITPKTKPAIMPPLGKPKHSPCTRL